jgi:hypothetical protein
MVSKESIFQILRPEINQLFSNWSRLTLSGMYGEWSLLIIQICWLNEKSPYRNLVWYKVKVKNSFHFGSCVGVFLGGTVHWRENILIYYNETTY